jgi:hypothetical protein
MTQKLKNEQAKRKFYQTLYRLGVSESTPFPISSNIYIDDSGYVMIIHADGLVSAYGELSLTGEFICKTQKMD